MVRIPWSVNFIDIMNCITSSLYVLTAKQSCADNFALSRQHRILLLSPIIRLVTELQDLHSAAMSESNTES